LGGLRDCGAGGGACSVTGGAAGTSGVSIGASFIIGDPIGANNGITGAAAGFSSSSFFSFSSSSCSIGASVTGVTKILKLLLFSLALANNK
jgi:hypothetical protein